jgi:hypothetical protein
MSWSIVSCQYEGGGAGPVVDVFVETDDVEEANRMIRDNKDKIQEFTEHSVQEEYMYPVSHPSFDYYIQSREDVREELLDMFSPDYAVCEDGTVLWMKYHGEVVEV